MHPAHRQWLAEHDSLVAVLQGVQYLAARLAAGFAPAQRAADLAALRAAFVYLGDYPERLHHPREESELFSVLRGRSAELDRVIDSLSEQHRGGKDDVARLEHALNRAEFGRAEDLANLGRECRQFVAAYLDHIETEERELMDPAERLLSEQEWSSIAEKIARDRDPLVGLARDAPYEGLIAAIDLLAPAALGVGARQDE